MMRQQTVGPSSTQRRRVVVSVLVVWSAVLLARAFGMPLPGVRASESPRLAVLEGRHPFREKLAPGRVLVASRQLRDPNFAETVVLILAYSERGAQGLIINRPTTVQLATVLPDYPGLKQRSAPIYIGGPVRPRRIKLLVQSDQAREGMQPVFADIYVSESRTVFERLLGDPTATERFRAYAGYAGWSPGQLDREVARGDWHVTRTDAKTIFDETPSAIWPELIRRSALKWL